ncbi:hypothetical protein B6S44_21625 [Bosea sp. Tri-44]|uniref:8-oxoguanine DNA glycosylase n=1 Tax=Bosea sp. Tri-44 TaxID=1972137 RepID=UPI00100DFDBE|nr:hypothetical protein [Bosea sp. Tri-44]RXT51207.1 hypothetical protein B6S44_21625 [Bosea sp. Tri-44]
MQNIDIVLSEGIHRVPLPDPDAEWSAGYRWGDASFLLTPSWIAKHTHMRWRIGTYSQVFGGVRWNLAEEVVFCILSGFGIRAEVAEAALSHLQRAGLFQQPFSVEEIERLLREPLQLGSGKRAKYRFPQKRAQYIHGALERLSDVQEVAGDLELRDRLLAIRGVGPKTASFIVRNLLGSDKVAILDVHVLRACKIARIFPPRFDLAKDYGRLERRFLDFADAAGVPASILDATIWEMARDLSPSSLAAADRMNRGLAASEGLPVPTYDPSSIIDEFVILEGGSSDRGKKGLPVGRLA